ncbi:MAG: bifunctional adenosylcobinamide kinase/adenosylcobinamide-phosphate guanylyltransferase [Oscillospiraceae bacterium]|nr:bifunctional adenosylcobinamide kinase/adenosylcobinamide-phosphate guanylyltransferase [Oscillospiraceae bacterium]
MLNLIIGGAGSGKSAFAEELVCRLSGPRVYLATMEAPDAESCAKIARHRAQRAPYGFTTVERCTDLAGAAIPSGANVLLEDLANLLANEMFSENGGGADAVRRGLTSVRKRAASLTIVTNELFSVGAEYAGETLAYLRELACLNRELAARADLAVEVVCGLPHVLKGELP